MLQQVRSMPSLPKILRIARFARDEAGGITAESVLWIPVYMVFFALIVDVSLVLNAQAKARHIVQDANRHASTGYLVTEDDLAAGLDETREPRGSGHRVRRPKSLSIDDRRFHTRRC